MIKYSQNNGCSIVLYNAPTRDEAKRIRRDLLEKKLIRGGFIVQIEPGFMTDEGEIKEEDEYYVVYVHTHSSLTESVLREIEKISESKGMSWDLKEGTDNYTSWVNKIVVS